MIPLLKLILVLLLIPSLFSLLPLRKLRHHEICYVSPNNEDFDDNLKVKGITSTTSTGTNSGSKYNEYDENNIDSNDPGRDSYFGIWISSMSVGFTRLLYKCNVHHPASQSKRAYHPLNTMYGSWLDCDATFNTKYDESKQAWCFVRNGETASEAFCSDSSSPLSSSIPTGTYSHISKNGNRSSLFVTCMDDNSHNNTYKKSEFYPTTSFLLLLNTGLAFLYWDKRIDPSLISKNYFKIIHEKQLWRSFTGALAHFEGMHLLFNMMTLQALGTILEETLGSVPFLYSNICMIPLTSIVMMVLLTLQMRYTQNDTYGHTNSVGYSGVLFAWSVVSSLRSHSVCPIPFANDVCFNTYTYQIPKTFVMLKFNLGPFVQLLIIQLIMPRVSFVGHLSGIICGYLFHWKLLPCAIFWNPQVLLPSLILFHWKFVRNLIPFSNRSETSSTSSNQSYDIGGGIALGGGNSGSTNGGRLWNLDDDAIETGNVTNNSLLRNKENESTSGELEMKKKKDKQFKSLHMTKRFMIISTIVSFLTLDVYSSMTISHLLSCWMFLLSVQCHTRSLDPESTGTFSSTSSLKNTSIILWRGTIITLIIILITDAMVVPIWLSSRFILYSYYSKQHIFNVWNMTNGILSFESLGMMIRWIVHFIALMVSSKSLFESGGGVENEAEPKIFDKVFGSIVNWSTSASTNLSINLLSSSVGTSTATTTTSSSSFTPFGGSGNTLGTASRDPTSVSQRSRLV